MVYLGFEPSDPHYVKVVRYQLRQPSVIEFTILSRLTLAGKLQ